MSAEEPIVFVVDDKSESPRSVDFLTNPARDQQLLDRVKHAIGRDRMVQQHRAELTELRRFYESLTHRDREVTLVVTGPVSGQILRSSAHRAQLMHKMRAKSPRAVGENHRPAESSSPPGLAAPYERLSKLTNVALAASPVGC